MPAKDKKHSKTARSLTGPGADELWAELHRIANKNRGKGSSGPPPPDASPLDWTKHDLCERLLTYKREHNLSQRELADKLGVVESRVSEAIRYRIHKFTLDRLVRFHQTLDPTFSLIVAEKPKSRR